MSNAETADTPQAHCGRAETSDVLRTLEQLKIVPSYNPEDIRNQHFKRFKDDVYLDWSGAALYGEGQIRSVTEDLTTAMLGNPHSRHGPSDTTTQVIDATRQTILDRFNTTDEEYAVIFTSGATAAIKLVADNFPWNASSSNTEQCLSDKCQANVEMIRKSSINGQNGSYSDQCDFILKPFTNKTDSINRGCFVYAQENHTSVLGMRNCASRFGAQTISMPVDKLRDIMSVRFDGGYATTRDPNHIDQQKFEVSARGNLDSGKSRVISENVAKEEMNHPVTSYGLFAYSAQCNYSGDRLPVSWVKNVQEGALDAIVNDRKDGTAIQLEGGRRWFVLLDAASYVATSTLDLSATTPDFVPISFYKIIGYPTGLGCLLVHRRAWGALGKCYFGGGTVEMADSRSLHTVMRQAPQERFEDGTVPFLAIAALRHGFESLSKLCGSMNEISDHTYHLARYVHHSLASYRHSTGIPVSVLYGSQEPWSQDTRGPIVNFNLVTKDGDYVGYSHVERMASLYGLHLRTGCLCNPGACQRHLGITSQLLRKQFQAGHVCGDLHDLVDGDPTGSIRVSFGYCSTFADADLFLEMVREVFVHKPLRIDTTWLGSQHQQREKRAVRPSNTLLSSGAGKKCNNTDELSQSARKIFHNDTKEAAKENGSDMNHEINKLILSDVSIYKNYIKKNNRNIPSSDPLVLTDIFIYPVKSCGAVCVKSWKFGSRGLLYDRHWMVVSKAGNVIRLNKCPVMSLISPHIDQDKGFLRLSYPEYGSVSVPLEDPVVSPLEQQVSIRCSGKVCFDNVHGIDCGDEVGDWLTEVLSLPNLRLMRQAGKRSARISGNSLTASNYGRNKSNHPTSVLAIVSPDKQSTPAVTSQLSFANDCQLVILHRPSIRYLAAAIKKNNFDTSYIDWNEEGLIPRFRGNLVFDGGVEWEEDEWSELHNAHHELKISGPCPRCAIISVDPSTGNRSIREPLSTLNSVRGSKFGSAASVHISNGRIQVGDVFYRTFSQHE